MKKQMSDNKDENVFVRLFRRLGNKRALQKIVEAGGNQQRLEVKYKKRNGEVVTRVIRPYEIKKHPNNNTMMLYVTDNKHGAQQILSLHADQILSAKPLTNTSYKPVWPINLSKKQINNIKRR